MGSRMVVDPNSFTYIDQTPVSFMQVVMSVPEGMVAAAEIIFFIFIVGGSFFALNATGAIDAGLGKLISIFAGKEVLVIPIVMLAFAFLGGSFGMAEETIPFIPILITFALAVGYDSITGVAMVFVGAAAGFTTAFTNPFTVGVAQTVSELPMFSGMWFRICMFVIMVTCTITFVMRYAMKIKKNPELSVMYKFDQTRELLDKNNLPEFTLRRKLVLLVLLGTVVMLIVGVLVFEWYLAELSALFLIMGFLAAIIGGLGFNGFAVKLAEGMAGITGGALVVGFARAILVVMTKGNIIHTMLFAAAKALSGLHPNISVLGMYIFQGLLNFFVPSGSGQAALSMPIMAPLSDLLGITRQTAVVTYQLADGIANVFFPTSGYFMAGLALGKVPYEKWVKWILPLICFQYLLGALFIVIAQTIQLGPF
jgi:uncharacterized ion transporter superfamily protein YfcC